MSTKFFCDVCEKETKDSQEFKMVSIGRKDGRPPLVFDICEECATAMFKPVKVYHTTMTIRITEESETRTEVI